MGGKRKLILLIFVAPLVAAMTLQKPAELSRPQVGGPQAKVTTPRAYIRPCQECHTYTSWKPIRSNPEFNHDQTGYPLRGMHQKVGCTQVPRQPDLQKRKHALRRLPCRYSSPAVRREL